MMALRHRLTLLAAGTVGITVVLVSVVAFLVLRNELRGQVDDALADQYTQVASRADRFGFSPELRFPAPPARGGAPSGPVQLLNAEKDLSHALELARRCGITMPTTALVSHGMARVYQIDDPARR